MRRPNQKLRMDERRNRGRAGTSQVQDVTLIEQEKGKTLQPEVSRREGEKNCVSFCSQGPFSHQAWSVTPGTGAGCDRSWDGDWFSSQLPRVGRNTLHAGSLEVGGRLSLLLRECRRSRELVGQNTNTSMHM